MSSVEQNSDHSILSVWTIIVPELEPDLSYLDPVQDRQVLDAYARGEWSVVGIQAQAEVIVSTSGVVQNINSGGLWGIESDGSISSQRYIQEIAHRQIQELERELQAAGFSDQQIQKALLQSSNVDLRFR